MDYESTIRQAAPELEAAMQRRLQRHPGEEATELMDTALQDYCGLKIMAMVLQARALAELADQPEELWDWMLREACIIVYG